MSLSFYYILHVSSVLTLAAFTFYAFAAPPETRKRVMIITGVASLLALLGGFALLGKLHYGFPGWAIVKLVCWFLFSGLAGMGYRKRGAIGVLSVVGIALLVVAVTMVYTKPF